MEIKEAMEILEKDIHTEVPKAAISARKHDADYVKRCKMKVIGNIWDKSEDAKPKETDNIIYHDFTKKGRE